MANLQAVMQKFGSTPDIDSGDTNEDIWDGTGAYPFPAAKVAMTISSSSTDDVATTGTGAWTVTVIGLDEDWNEVTQTVSMNGQSGVSIPTALIRVFRAFVATSGTGGINAGDIWVGFSTITAGVPATKYAGILATVGQTLMSIYSIPATATGGGTIVSWYGSIGAVQSAFATIALQVREFGGAWATKRMASIAEGGQLHEDLTWLSEDGARIGGVSIGPKADIRIRALSCGTSNSTITAGFNLELLS